MNTWLFSLAHDMQSYEIFEGGPYASGRTVGNVKLYDDAQDICDAHNREVAEHEEGLDE